VTRPGRLVLSWEKKTEGSIYLVGPKKDKKKGTRSVFAEKKKGGTTKGIGRRGFKDLRIHPVEIT